MDLFKSRLKVIIAIVLTLAFGKLALTCSMEAIFQFSFFFNKIPTSSKYIVVDLLLSTFKIIFAIPFILLGIFVIFLIWDWFDLTENEFKIYFDEGLVFGVFFWWLIFYIFYTPFIYDVPLAYSYVGISGEQSCVKLNDSTVQILGKNERLELFERSNFGEAKKKFETTFPDEKMFDTKKRFLFASSGVISGYTPIFSYEKGLLSYLKSLIVSLLENIIIIVLYFVPVLVLIEIYDCGVRKGKSLNTPV